MRQGVAQFGLRWIANVLRVVVCDFLYFLMFVKIRFCVTCNQIIVVHLSVETTALFKTVARTTEVDNIVCMFSYQMAERYLYTA